MIVNGKYRVYQVTQENQEGSRHKKEVISYIKTIPMLLVPAQKDYIVESTVLATEQYLSGVVSRRYPEIQEGLFVEYNKVLYEIVSSVLQRDKLILKLEERKGKVYDES